jgi:hypothetical protein
MIAMAAAAVGAVVAGPIPRTSALAPAASATAPSSLKTPWGKPDLQGIWTDETEQLVKTWEGDTMRIDITRKVPPGDLFYQWYGR